MNGKCTITLDGQVVQLRFGLPANRLFWQGLEQHPDSLIGDNLNETGIAILLHAGYQNACMVNDEEPVHKRGRFIEYVEDAQLDSAKLDEMRAAVQCFNDSAHTKDFSRKISEKAEELKKKVQTLMQSNRSVSQNSSSRLKSIKPVRSGSTSSATRATKGSRKKN